MKIALHKITIRQLAEGYEDRKEEGVVGFGGKLDIRPPYQREFIYKEAERNAVIDTVTKDFPLNVMYWAVREDGSFEVIDGQQRTISICEFVKDGFSVNNLFLMEGSRGFQSLQPDEQEKILNYELHVYRCEGAGSEKLKWFKTINIAGQNLTNQELRNAVYAGSWLTDAKRYFSKNYCAAYGIGSDYLKGRAIRQEYLETAIKWISKDNIESYMATHQHEPNANELWLYFRSVIAWVRVIFPHYRREMKGLDWGRFYNRFKDNDFDSAKLEEDISALMQDEDVTKKRGIYEYVLTGEEKHLNIRAFSSNQKREAYERQKGICPVCQKAFQLKDMEADHITPWIEGGRTSAENCQMLCREDNRRKGAR